MNNNMKLRGAETDS